MRATADSRRRRSRSAHPPAAARTRTSSRSAMPGYRVLERGRLFRLDGPSIRTLHVNLDEALNEGSDQDHEVARISGIQRPEFLEPTPVADWNTLIFSTRIFSRLGTIDLALNHPHICTLHGRVVEGQKSARSHLDQRWTLQLST